MTNVLVDDSYLSDIADTIRSKLGVADTYLPSEMADAIDDIGGGVTPTGTKQISITANGTTTEDVTAYANAEITASVPNSYTAGDEGKVVNNGGLVAQTSDTVTQNGTVDTTLINSLTVNVSGGLSVLSGSFTPSENSSSQVVSALVGTTLKHFLVMAIPTLATVNGHSVRAFAMGFIDYDENNFYSIGSNSAGSNVNTTTSGTIASGNVFKIDRTTGTFSTSTGSNGGGYLVGGVTYNWFAW